MASELKVNKISPESGTTLTLGDSGDTINFGSGVLPNFENLTVTGDLTVDTNSLKVDSTNNFVGIGTASPSVALDVVGAITATGNITGTLATAAQPNITSLGTLTGLTTTGDINLGDSDKINFGAGNDLQIYHNGTHSYIDDAGTGNLFVRADNYLLIEKSDSSKRSASFNTDDAVILNFNNNQKFTTTSSGIDVTGTVVSDGLTVDTNTLYVDSTNNRVGINTSSPTYALDVESAESYLAHFVGTGTNAFTQLTTTTHGVTTSNGLIFGIDANGDSYIINRENASLRFSTNNTERARFTNGGRLGIGTTNPTHELMVAGGTDTRVTIDGSSSAGLYITDSGASGVTIRNTNDGDLEFLGVSGKSFVFNQASINTDFRIESDANANMFFVDASDGTVARFITSSSSGILQVGNSQTGTGTGPELRFHHNNALGSRIISESTEDFASAGNQSAKMKFNAKSNGNNYDMVTMIPGISASLVGINTTSPQKALHVVGPDGSAGVTEGNSNTALYVDNNDSCIINIQSGTGTTDYGSIFFSDAEAQNRGAIYYNHPDDSFRFNTAASERMRITSDGRVGIGTTSPSYKLTLLEGGNNFIQISQSGDSSAGSLIGRSGSTNLRIQNSENADIEFWTNNTARMEITNAGHLIPTASNTYDLGSSSLVWRNIYTSDFHMSNEGLDKGNDIDGTKGSWTFQEGENDLFLINNKNGKKYKFNLTEVA
jgi:hypothetical protein